MKRARNTTQKENRRDAIMEAALDLLDTENFHDISMNMVAKAAGLAKGTLYLYFKTKEELFLAIHSEMFETFFDELNSELDKLEGGSTQQLAEFTGKFIASRPMLMRLMTLSHTVLEKNTKEEAIVAFKSKTLANVAKTGAKLETLLPFIQPGQGPFVVMSINALILGAHQLTYPAPNVAEITKKYPELSPFKLETEPFLIHLIQSYLYGLESTPR
ncbi:MAG: TetR family transcriptional regulator [Chloroflexota bacterium]